MPSRSPGRFSDQAFGVAAWVCGLIGLVLPLAILGYLAFHGASRVSWEFLSEPPKGFPLGSKGGILPAIQGTLALVAVGLLIALPFAVGGAVYLSEYCPWPRVNRTLQFAAEFLASVPALLFGLWGFSF